MIDKQLVEPKKIKAGLYLTGYAPETRTGDRMYFSRLKDAQVWYNDPETELLVVKAHKTHGFYGMQAYPVYEVKK